MSETQGNQKGNQAKKTQINLQDTYLEQVCKNRIQISIFLCNGYQMKGIVKAYDNFTILLMKDGKEHLIYKSSITTIEPHKSLDMTI